MAQALHIANGDTINDKLKQKGSRIDSLISSRKPASAIIEEAYLASVSRLPTPEESKAMTALVDSTKAEAEKREILQDILWSLLSSRDFVFNH
jgi:hypothetical protein